MQLLVLCPLIFLAGFIDSIAGGGGLISLTSFNATGVAGTMGLGTNKLSMSIGTAIASYNFIKTKNYHLPSLFPALAGALIGSALGSRTALIVSNKVLSVFMIIATPIVAVITVMEKNFDKKERTELSRKVYIIAGLATGLVIGFYDGFFGPGTGVLLQLAFISLLKLEPLKAAGNARIVNLGSNIVANITFIISKNVLFSLAIPCAICSILGNFVGSRLAIKKDVKIIKPLMLVVVILLFIKLVLSYFGIL